MRVLFTTTSGRGHYQPMLPLARALVDAGHEVRSAAAEQACAALRDRGFDAVPAGIFELVPSPLRDPPPEIATLPPAEPPNLLFALVFGPLRAQPMLADLMPIVDGWRPHVVISEQGELAAPIAAACHDVPNVTHGFGRLLPAARVARAGDSMAQLWRAHGLEPRPYAGTYDHLYMSLRSCFLRPPTSSSTPRPASRAASRSRSRARRPRWLAVRAASTACSTTARFGRPPSACAP